MKVLFLFWHGLGDNVLATPAIKAYKKANPNHIIGWAMLRRFRAVGLYNPYIDEYFYTSDAWNDFDNYQEGRERVYEEAVKIAQTHHYDKVITISHLSSRKHKIHRTADEMGVKVTDVKTEFYFKYPNCGEMQGFNYAFFHGKTGVAKKDLPFEWAEKRIPKDLHIINGNCNMPAWYWAEWIKYANYLIMADSFYFHVACALGRVPDLVYFQRGKPTFEEVKPLHLDVSKNVIFEL